MSRATLVGERHPNRVGSSSISRGARFARALALLTGGVSTACSSSPGSTAAVSVADSGPIAIADSDVATDSSPVVVLDTGSAGDTALEDDASVDAAPPQDPPKCADEEEEITCKAGGTCFVETKYGYMLCQVLETGVNKPCGQISCGWQCACSDPATSSCFCYGDSGPLPPPDLPRALS